MLHSDEVLLQADDIIAELTSTKEEYKTKVSDLLNALL